jgi:predicted protein tyrosine phosphatase
VEIISRAIVSIDGMLRFDRNKWDVICIRNSDAVIPQHIRMCSRNFLELTFDDIDCPLASYIMPSKSDVKRALDFKSNKLIVACYSGNTRSTAIAYVIKCKQCGDPSHAITMLSPNDYPNRKVIEYGAELLEDKRILKVYNNWIKKPIYYVDNK